MECKIFFSVLAKKVDNLGFSGYLEHTGTLNQLICEAKESKGNVTIVWLDLANAYGSIPHDLINAALEHYHNPHNISGMITNYFGRFKLRFMSAKFTTKWQTPEKGILMSCTPILFIMGMNLLITAAGKESRGPQIEFGIRQPPKRGFLDDLTIQTSTHVQAKWIVKALDDVAMWA